MDILVFRAGDARWGVDVTRVSEILDTISVTPLPGLPEWMPGLMDHRGSLMPVIDFRLLSGSTPAGRDTTMVIAIDDRELALTVDGVDSTESVDPSSVEPDPDRPWTVGVAGDVTILDPETLLEQNPKQDEAYRG